MNKSESKYFNTAVRLDCALISLLEKKPLEYITVSEICRTAGVNRSTFYLHYENTRELLEETTKYLLDQFASYFTGDSKNIVSNFSECSLSELNFITDKYLHPYLSYIKDNRRVFSSVLLHPEDFQFDSIFQKLFRFIFDPILDRFHYTCGERKYVMMYYLNGLTAIIKEWLQNECKESIEELSEIIRHCIFGKDDQLLRKM